VSGAVIPALSKLRQEDHEFEPSLDCIVRPCLRKERGRGEGSKREGKRGEERRRRRGKKCKVCPLFLTVPKFEPRASHLLGRHSNT
jgi:hypothetical protein